MTLDEKYDELREPDYVLAKVKHPIIALISFIIGGGLAVWGFIDLPAAIDTDIGYGWAIGRVLVGFVLAIGIGGTLTAAGPRKIYKDTEEEA